MFQQHTATTQSPSDHLHRLYASEKQLCAPQHKNSTLLSSMQIAPEKPQRHRRCTGACKAPLPFNPPPPALSPTPSPALVVAHTWLSSPRAPWAAAYSQRISSWVTSGPALWTGWKNKEVKDAFLQHRI